jgi:hypothetical protein
MKVFSRAEKKGKEKGEEKPSESAVLAIDRACAPAHANYGCDFD